MNPFFNRDQFISPVAPEYIPNPNISNILDESDKNMSFSDLADEIINKENERTALAIRVIEVCLNPPKDSNLPVQRSPYAEMRGVVSTALDGLKASDSLTHDLPAIDYDPDIKYDDPRELPALKAGARLYDGITDLYATFVGLHPNLVHISDLDDMTQVTLPQVRTSPGVWEELVITKDPFGVPVVSLDRVLSDGTHLDHSGYKLAALEDGTAVLHSPDPLAAGDVHSPEYQSELATFREKTLTYFKQLMPSVHVEPTPKAVAAQESEEDLGALGDTSSDW